MDKMRFRTLMGQFPRPLLNFSVLKHIKVPMDGQFVGLFILSRLIVAGGGGGGGSRHNYWLYCEM